MKNNLEVLRSMIKPSLEIDEDTLPEIKSWQVGKKYKLEIQAELCCLEKEGDKIKGEFDIKKVKY